MTDLEKFLREMGLEAAKEKPKPPLIKRQFEGVWYRDGDIPH